MTFLGSSSSTTARNRETGPALVAVELAHKKDLAPLLQRMKKASMKFELLEKDSPMFRYVV